MPSESPRPGGRLSLYSQRKNRQRAGTPIANGSADRLARDSSRNRTGHVDFKRPRDTVTSEVFQFCSDDEPVIARLPRLFRCESPDRFGGFERDLARHYVRPVVFDPNQTLQKGPVERLGKRTIRGWREPAGGALIRQPFGSGDDSSGGPTRKALRSAD